MRGATVAAAQSDRTPPVVTARFPSRLPRTRTARVRFDVPVSCSEACDAILTVEPPKNATALESGYVRLVRALPADQTRVLPVRIGGSAAGEIRDTPRARTLRVHLVISDRAGNLYRHSRTLRVRLAL
jgi:hypothetical protein